MSIRKITYSTHYTHVLTFLEHYKSIIAPYFRYEPLEYGIDNESSYLVNIRLIFRVEGFILQFNKESATLIYEGDVADVKKSNPIIDIFFEIMEKIKKIDGFIRIINSRLIVDSVIVTSKERYTSLLETNKFVLNPFGKLDEFAVVYEYKKDDKMYKFEIGNFNDQDIIKRNLSPIQSQYNKDLLDKYGIISQMTIVENSSTINHSKFKSLLAESENISITYLKNEDYK